MGTCKSKTPSSLTCPLCKEKVGDELALIQHCNQLHSNSQQQQSHFKTGDRVLAMWTSAMWQYFPATIAKKLSNGQYEINWDDGDTTGLLFFHSFIHSFIILSTKVFILLSPVASWLSTSRFLKRSSP